MKRARRRIRIFGLKGVSAVIAVLLMIAIAVIAALIAYFWVMGYFKTTSSKVSKAIQIPSAYYTGRFLCVYVQNAGQGKATLAEGQCLYVDGRLEVLAHVNPGGLHETSYTLLETETVILVDQVNLTLGQTIKIKVVTTEGTFVEKYLTINGFAGQNPYSLTVIVDPPAGGTVDLNDSGPYDYGDVVQLTSNAETGWTFLGWSQDLSGSSNPATITIDTIKTVKATFAQNDYVLTLNEVGSGSASKFPDQASYHYGDSVQLTATAATGWTFSGWSGDLTDTINPAILTIDETPEVTATFTQNDYVLIINTVGSGSVSKNPDLASYHYGDSVQLTANAATGWIFVGWTGDLTSSTNPDSVIIDETPTVTATFTQNEYVLSITVNPSAGGSVSKLPDQATYHYGDSVELTATANTGWTFAGWSGDLSSTTNPDTVIIDETPEVTATFTQNEYTLTINVSPLGSGGVATNQSAPYHYGDWVLLTANANTGWAFSGWSGDLTGSVNPTAILIDGSKTVTAIFTQDSYLLTMIVNGQGTVNPGNSIHLSGTVVNIEAINPLGWTFAGWSGDATGTTNTTITMNGPRTVTATFTQNTYTLTVTANPIAGGTVTRNNTGSYHYGDWVRLTAAANSGYAFSSWSGDLSGSVNPANIFIDGNKAVTANFVLTQVQVTFVVDPLGRGTTTPSIGPHMYNLGENISISASDANLSDSYVFCYWNATLGTATFGNQYAASTTAVINGAGSITAYFRIPTTIDWYTDPSNLGLGETEDIGGVLYPVGDWWLNGLNGMTVRMVFTAPNATQITKTDVTGPFWLIFNGGFSNSFIPDAVGTWSVYAQFDGNAQYNASRIGPNTFTVSAVPQYTVSFTQTGAGAAPNVTYHIDSGSDQQGTVPFNVQVTQGHQITYSYQLTVPGTSGVQYVLTNTNPSSPRTINGPQTITGTYKTQYQVTFDQIGLDSTSQGTVVTVGGVDRTRTQLPYTDWFDNGTTYSYGNSVLSSTSGKRFALTGVTGLTSPIIASGTVTGNYKIQYQITFGQTGLDSTASGTVVTINGTAKTYSQLPSNTWVDSGDAITYSYSNVSSSTTGKRFNVTGVSGPASPITVTSPVTVTANYQIQYQVTFGHSGLESTATGIVVTVDGSAKSYTDLPFSKWVVSGTPVVYTYANVSSSVAGKQFRLSSVTGSASPINVLAPTTVTGNYVTQYQVTFAVSPSGNGTINRATGWYDSGSLSLTATANSGYAFSSWSSNTTSITFANSGSSTTTATINGPGTITASFTRQVTFVSAGTGSGATGSPTPAYPTGLQANDLILLQVTVRDTSNTPTTPTGFTLLYGPDSTGTGRQWIYYKFAAGTESGTITITISGSNCKIARMYAFRNVALSSFIEGGGFGSGDSRTISAQSVATTSSGRLAVSLVFVNNDNSVGSFTGETGGDWAEAATEFTTSAGSNGCVQLQTATMTGAGTISGGSYDMGSGNSDPWGARAFALKPPP